MAAIAAAPPLVRVGFDTTPQEAVDAVPRAWAHHADQTGADPGHVTRDDVNVITGEAGQGFRDYSPLPTTPATPTRGRAPRRRPRSNLNNPN